MKKLFIGISLAAFLLFGVISIQTTLASKYNVEILKFDKDPDGKNKKENKKADKKSEKATTDAKAGKKDCATKGDCKAKSDCKDKKSSCCSKSHPDKK